MNRPIASFDSAIRSSNSCCRWSSWELQTHRPDLPLSLSGIGIDATAIDQSAYWEGYAINGNRRGVHRLAATLRHDPKFRDWLKSEPELIHEYLRPLLLRIAQSPDPSARYDAIEAMLLLDDRSSVMLDILRRSTQRAEKEPPGLSKLERLRFYDVDPVRAKELIDEFELVEEIEKR